MLSMMGVLFLLTQTRRFLALLSIVVGPSAKHAVQKISTSHSVLYTSPKPGISI